MNFSKGRSRYRAITSILDIPLDKEGILRFELLLNGKHEATHLVIVHPLGVREPDESFPRQK